MMSTAEGSCSPTRWGQGQPDWLSRTRLKLCGLVALAVAGAGTGAPAVATVCVVVAGAVTVAAVAIQGGLPLLGALFFIPPRPEAAGRHQERNEPDE